MAKSFIPQYIAMLHKLAEYVAKHQGTMASFTLTAGQLATFAAILAADAAWAGVPFREEP